MYQRRRARVMLAVLVLATLVLITVDFRAGGDGPLSHVRAVATSAFEPVQDGLATMLRPLGGAVSNVTGLFRLRERNAELEARLAELDQQRRSFADLERQNAELRALLDMRERSGFDAVTGRVVALAPSNYEWTVTLDIGAAHGVGHDMPVVSADGLVGRVVQVTERASRVLLAIDPNFSAAARVARLGDTGLIEGQGGELMRLQPLDPEVAVEVGDEIVTGSYDHGIFPAGIPIGTVEDIGETSALDRSIAVRPYVDFTSLETVLVVRNAPVSPLPIPPDGSEAPLEIPDFPTPAPSPSPTPSPDEATDPDATVASGGAA